MKYFFRLLLVAFLFVCCSKGIEAQKRPKVGLVLSGGAAHGLAHIGVIKYLEEIGIEVDYITGTSMGAVVGGVYAMGFDFNEIRNIAAAQDWSVLMSNNTPLYEVAPIEKEHHERIPLSIYWKEDTFTLPQSIIRGQKLDIILANMYSPAYRIRNFDDLKIPFRCVAIDIEDGGIKVFDEGYIGNAIRASMAIPSVFPPFELEDRLYVDGGLIRNFPVQECIDLGADIIIGVYVGGVKSKRDELNSMFDLLRQSAAMGSILDSESQSNLADIVIKPDVKEMKKFDFNNFDGFIEKGYEAAKQYEDVLKKLASDCNKFESPKRNDAVDYPLKIKVDSLIISEDQPVLREMIKNRLGFHEGQYIALSELQKGLALTYGTKNFSQTSYSFDYKDGKSLVKVKTDEVEPYTIGVSLNRFKHYNASFIINAQARNVAGMPSNFRMDLRVSENPGMQGEYYLRIPQEPSILAKLYGKYELYDLPIFRGKVVDRLYNAKQGEVRFELVHESENIHLISLGIEYKYDGLSPKIFKTNDVKKYNTHKFNLSLGYELNTLDKKLFPEKGSYFRTEVGYIFNNRLIREDQTENVSFLPFEESKRYFYSQLSYQKYFHFSKLFCAEFHINARYATGQSFLDNYKIGGPIQEKGRYFGFVGVDDSELLIDNHVAVKYGMRLHLSESIYVTPMLQYLYGRNLVALSFGDEDSISSVFSYGVVLGVESPIGPLVFDFGYAGLRDKVIVNLGIGYRHIF